MKLFLFSLITFFAFSNAYAFGPQMIKKEFKCSIGSDYSVYIIHTTGMTNSYKVHAFCLDTNDMGAESCLQDEEADTYTCYEEFNSLNELKAGDGPLIINHGRN